MGSPEIVPVTPDMITAFHGGAPYSLRGLAVVKDGLPICIAGVRREHGRFIMFADVSEEMRKYPKVGLQLARRMMELVASLGRVYAVADDKIPRSREFLEHLGFEQLGETEVYVWRA